ncbi:ABC transporter permease [Ruegeria sp. 2012CJ41-6]|uniref:ABC transporter permease n=1 Tax=Ruegeria spongiae TaxID=2942209 RepID=A0ABT0QB12_9RHOB|nr:ABC transporter permease [Ruegeria spongiae]MCL6286084.1 ABC transporter permease [Ruegeria spongiae]
MTAFPSSQRNPVQAIGGHARSIAGWCLKEPTGAFGALILALLILAAIFAPVITSYEPNAVNYRDLLQPPGATHLLGTDELGRDIFSRLLYGARLSMAVGVSAVVLSVLVGVPIGLLSGYVGGFVDELIMRVFDSVIALPPLVLALTISALLGPGLVNATIAISIVSVPTYIRLTRGQVLSIKNEDYVLAARSIGVPVWNILFVHILPNAIAPVIVQASLGLGFAIILESSLSFIGLGAQPPVSTWGSMVQTSFQFLSLAPWFVIAPAVAIFAAVLGANLLGEGLRNSLDPHQKQRM